MSAWPESLPRFRGRGYSISPLDQVLRSQMEAGADRTRRRTRVRNDRVSGSCLFTNAQLAVFRAWFDDDVDGAAGGAGWFGAVLALDGAPASVEARFVGTFSLARSGTLWVMSATLEVR